MAAGVVRAAARSEHADDVCFLHRLLFQLVLKCVKQKQQFFFFRQFRFIFGAVQAKITCDRASSPVAFSCPLKHRVCLRLQIVKGKKKAAVKGAIYLYKYINIEIRNIFA